MRRAPVACVVGGVLLAASVVAVPAHGAAAARYSRKPTSFRVATWNMLLDDKVKSDYTPWQRTHAVSAIVKRHHIGIIAAQEVTAWQRRRLLSDLPTYAATRSTARTIFWNSGRYEKLSEGWFTVTKTVGSSKGRWVKLRSKVNGRKFAVMSVHAEPYHKELHATNVRQILAMADKIDVPLIIAGDMNSDYQREQGTIYKGIDGTVRFELSYDVAARRLMGALCRTYTDQEEQTCKREGPVRQIDHLYASKWLRISQWANVATRQALVASDHNPVFAQLTLPPPP